jgi:predicted MPP superfamily phosphohydrolase
LGGGTLFEGITWSGVVLAALGQSLVLAAVARRRRLGRRRLARTVLYLLLADAAVVVALLALSAGIRPLNAGPRDRRGAVILVHLTLAVLIPWGIYAAALRRGTRRRALLASGMMVAVTAAGLALPGVRPAWSRRPARVNVVRVSLPRLPGDLDGLRIAVVGDTHLGKEIPAERVRDLLRPLSSVRADLVVFVGDLAHQNAADMAAAAAILGEDAPRVPRYAVIGNHDRWTDQQAYIREMGRQGFRVLVDDAARVPVRGTTVWLAGVNDPYTAKSRPDRALANIPADAFFVLLAHGPDILRDRRSRRADLILAGHTHGGQIRLPLIGPVSCSSWYGPRYASGLFTIGETKLFVTRGIGDGIVPVRVFCEPEVAVLELRRENNDVRR